MSDLPDLFLLDLFRKLSANDRLIAYKTCKNWYHRVREVNKDVQCLTITVDCQSIEDIRFKSDIEKLIFGYSPSMKQQLLSSEEGVNEANREKLEPCTKWNTLQFSFNSTGLQLNSTTIQQIIIAFSATTHLNFISQTVKLPLCIKYLEEALNQKSRWGRKQKTLRIFDLKRVAIPAKISKNFFNAINSLPDLRRLVIDVYNINNLELPDLLENLIEVRFTNGRDDDLIPFLRSVQENAANNADLQIDLPNGLEVLKKLREPTNENTNLLDGQIQKRIIRINNSYISQLGNYRETITSFHNLTSLSFECSSRNECLPLFNLISRNLPHLRHLNLKIHFNKMNDDAGQEENDYRIIIPPRISPMHSVEALELSVTITSHSDLQWLNFPTTMPNLQAIHFKSYHCKLCSIFALSFNTTFSNQKVIRQCLEAVLSQLSRSTGVSLEKITIKVSQGDFIKTAKQIFAQAN